MRVTWPAFRNVLTWLVGGSIIFFFQLNILLQSGWVGLLVGRGLKRLGATVRSPFDHHGTQSLSTIAFFTMDDMVVERVTVVMSLAREVGH